MIFSCTNLIVLFVIQIIMCYIYVCINRQIARIRTEKTILIDLDGVLNEYTGFFDEKFIPPIKFGAKVFLERLADCYEIKLFTTRNKILATNG